MGRIGRWLGKAVAGACLAVLVVVVSWRLLDAARDAARPRPAASDIAFSQFLADVEAGRVRDVLVDGDRITGHVKDGRSFTTLVPPHLDLVDRLTGRGVFVRAAGGDPAEGSALHHVLAWLPFSVFVLVAWALTRGIRAATRASEGVLRAVRDMAWRLAPTPAAITGAAAPADRPADASGFEVQIRLDPEDHRVFEKAQAARVRAAHPSLVNAQGIQVWGIGAVLAVAALFACAGLGGIEPTPSGLGLVAVCVSVAYGIGYEARHRHGEAWVRRFWEDTTAGEDDRWTTLRFGADGIAVSSATGRGFYTWSAVREVGENAGLIVMWLDERRAILLPRRFLPRPEMADALFRLARERRAGRPATEDHGASASASGAQAG